MTRYLLSYALFAVLPFGLLVAAWAISRRPLAIDPGRVAKVSLRYADWYAGDEPESFTRSTSRIAHLLSVLSNAEQTDDHRCDARAHMEFIRRDGERILIHLLPGHDPQYYQYRLGTKTYRVARDEFRSAIQGMDVDADLLIEDAPTDACERDEFYADED